MSITRYAAGTSPLAASPFSLTPGIQAPLTDSRAILFPLTGKKRAQIRTLGVGNAADTHTIEVYGVTRLSGVQAGSPDGLVDIECIGNLVSTLGTAAPGNSGTASVLTSEKIAHGMAWTDSSIATSPKGPTTAANTAFAGLGDGPNGVYTPADNTCAILNLSGLGRFDALLLRCASVTGSCTNYNALISLMD